MAEKIQENIKASVEIDGEEIIKMENSSVYLDNFIEEDMTIVIKAEDKEIRIRLTK